MSRLVALEVLFKGRHFDLEIVVLCLRWYLNFKPSYRELVSMMKERGICLAHTPILRLAQHYTPEFVKRWQCYARLIGDPGAWTKPMLRCEASRCTFTGRWTKAGKPSIST